jgi:CO/xanthine dehydrogenase Mo-binding subunit
MSSRESAVGASYPRLEAKDKIAGGARYIDDFSRAGQLYAAVTQSPYAHARIVRIDTEKAKALPGVRAVVTGADCRFRRVGGVLKDETMLATDKVRYVGEPVAAIAARDRAVAQQAAQLVEVEYEPLPAVFTIDDALAADAPLLHEDFADYVHTMEGGSHGNVIWESELAEGNPDDVWSRCDVIVEGTFETQAQQHGYMEPNGVLAEIDASGKLTIIASCQSAHHVQTRVSEELDVPMSQVRVIVPRVGGGFGGKHASNIHSIAAWLARETRKPVKFILSRTLDMEIQRSRHPARITLKTGAMKDGTILAREAHIDLDGGAYADESANVLAFALLMVRGPYRIAHVRVRGRAIYTNKLRAGSFRGFGNPQATFAGESQMDELAAALSIDPVALRLKNAIEAGDRWIGGHTIATCQLKTCLEAVRDSQKAAPALPPKAGRRRGIGFSSLTHISGLMGTSASVHLRTDGTVAVNTGCVDLGQGSDTVLAQLCAGILKFPLERVTYAAQDTDVSPYNWKTAGSRSTYMTGRAVVAASTVVREKILEHASEMLECAVNDVELGEGGTVNLLGVPGKKITFKDVALRSLFRSGGPIVGFNGFVYDGERFDLKRSVVKQIAFDNLGVYTFGAQCVEVDVDEDTGEVTVVRAWSAHDVGKAINPVSCEGQIQGAFVQGLGYALHEQMVWDDDGRLANPSLADYKLPGLLDVPRCIQPIILEDPDPTGPFGAKGIGEIAMVGVAPAIANALAQAIGIRLRTLPMKPERVVDACDARNSL